MTVQGGNVAISTADGSFSSGIGVIFIANRAVAPTGANPVNGGILYVQGGALRYKGSGGTDVQIAAA